MKITVKRVKWKKKKKCKKTSKLVSTVFFPLFNLANVLFNYIEIKFSFSVAIALQNPPFFGH